MDIDLLKTFLEVHKTRHFGHAAENLYLTSAAVSARIKQLEHTVGVSLFIRTRGNVRLTPEGERLLPQAEALVLTWQRTLQEISVRHAMTGRLHIGATAGLWQFTLQRKLNDMRQAMPDVALQAEGHNDLELVRKLEDRTLDIALLYDPPVLPELQATEVGQLDVVLASTSKRVEVEQALDAGYIYCDWGTAFSTFHARRFGDAPPATLRVNLASIAVSSLKENPGAVFLPRSLLERTDFLYYVEGSPTFKRRIYAATMEGGDQPELVSRTIEVLKGISI